MSEQLLYNITTRSQKCAPTFEGKKCPPFYMNFCIISQESEVWSFLQKILENRMLRTLLLLTKLVIGNR
jgi:hypothetical protein